MNKTKAALILVMLCGLLGYGAYQQQAATAPPPPTAPAAGDQQPPDPAAKQFEGKPLPAKWNIGKALWMNTPKPITPADLKGKITVLEFFRVDCSHCQEAVPFMKDMYGMFKSYHLQMVAFQSPGDVSKKERDWQQVQRQVRTWGIEYPVAFDTKRALFTRMGGQKFPTLLVVDQNGIVRLARSGYTAADNETIKEAIGHLMMAIQK